MTGRKLRQVINYNFDMGTIPGQPEQPGALLVSPGDPIGATETKRKKKGKRGKDYASPLHAQAEGYQEEMERSDMDKAIARENTPFGDRRVSGPVTDGHARPSSGDHGAGRGRNPNVAYGHQDLRQSNCSFGDVLARLRTVRGNVMDLGVSPDTPGGFSHAGEVALRAFNAANEAGAYAGMNPVDRNPVRPDYHQHRNSATPDNGTHSRQQGAVSHAVGGKSESRLAIMKREMRRIGQ